MNHELYIYTACLKKIGKKLWERIVLVRSNKNVSTLGSKATSFRVTRYFISKNITIAVYVQYVLRHFSYLSAAVSSSNEATVLLYALLLCIKCLVIPKLMLCRLTFIQIFLLVFTSTNSFPTFLYTLCIMKSSIYKY